MGAGGLRILLSRVNQLNRNRWNLIGLNRQLFSLLILLFFQESSIILYKIIQKVVK